MPHLDEGTIHAWLDGALTATEVADAQSHVRECKECEQRVAEARGLIAGATRILSALDDLPAAVPGRKTEDGRPKTEAETRKTVRRWRFAGPIGLAMAATLLVVVVFNERDRAGGARDVGEVAPSAASQPQKGAVGNEPIAGGGKGQAGSETLAAQDAKRVAVGGKLAEQTRGRTAEANRNEIKPLAKGDVAAPPTLPVVGANAPAGARLADAVAAAKATDSSAAATIVRRQDAALRDSELHVAQKTMLDSVRAAKGAAAGAASAAAAPSKLAPVQLQSKLTTGEEQARQLAKQEMIAAQVMEGAAGCYSGLPSGVVSLDTTRVSPDDAARRALRDVRNAIGEWRTIGRDSVVVTITSPERLAWRGLIAGGRLELRGVGSDTTRVTLIRVACPGS